MTRQFTVHFRNGTRVRVPADAGDPAMAARDLLLREGPVVIGTDQADIRVTGRPDLGGFLVHTHHPDIDTFVSDAVAEELGPPIPGWEDIKVGLMGREMRQLDVDDPAVVDVTEE